jgi:hypothetical protein
MASRPPVDNTLVEALAWAFRWRRRFVCAVAESWREISPAHCGTPLVVKPRCGTPHYGEFHRLAGRGSYGHFRAKLPFATKPGAGHSSPRTAGHCAQNYTREVTSAPARQEVNSYGVRFAWLKHASTCFHETQLGMSLRGLQHGLEQRILFQSHENGARTNSLTLRIRITRAPTPGVVHG